MKTQNKIKNALENQKVSRPPSARLKQKRPSSVMSDQMWQKSK